MPHATLLFAGHLGRYNGSFVYNKYIATGAADSGWAIQRVALEGRFPAADTRAHQSMQQALASCPDHSLVIIDGSALADTVETIARHTDRLYLIGLMHHPVAEEYGIPAARAAYFKARETAALALMRQVIVTSPFTAQRMPAYGVDPARTHTIPPGVAPADLGTANWPAQRLLCIATLTPRKGQRVLIDALATLVDLNWQCDLIGAAADGAYTVDIERAIAQHGLTERVRLLGPRAPAALAEAYQACDVFVLPSYYEGYGMVVSEALSYGLPVVTTNGGALADTLPRDAGTAVEPGDPRALAQALCNLLIDEARYEAARAGARAARRQLPTWASASASLVQLLEQISVEIR